MTGLDALLDTIAGALEAMANFIGTMDLKAMNGDAVAEYASLLIPFVKKLTEWALTILGMNG